MICKDKSFCTKYGWGEKVSHGMNIAGLISFPFVFFTNSSIIYYPLTTILSPANTIRKRRATLCPSAAANIIVIHWLQSNAVFLFVTNYLCLC